MGLSERNDFDCGEKASGIGAEQVSRPTRRDTVLSDGSDTKVIEIIGTT